MQSKKFLLITYYWPPAGGAGVMRWAKMTKYISDFGWEPVIFTPENGETGMHDPGLSKEIPSHIKIVRLPIWEPYSLYKTFLGRSKKEKMYSGFINEKKKASLAQRISVFIRGNFFIPDARKFWIRPASRFLVQYLKENPVDAIVSTGPPHSMHLIARKVHAATGIPWISDFRDPWTNIDFYKDLQLTAWADARHHSLEKKVLLESDKVVTVTWRSRDEFAALSGRDDIEVIPNGFDHADFVSSDEIRLDTTFSLVHIGSMNKDRNPHVLWKAIQLACAQSEALQKSLEIKLVGPMDFSVRSSIEESGLVPYTTIIDQVPHTEAVKLQQQAQVLLLVINNTANARTIIPGKLYEYLGSGRPIVATGPKDSDSAQVIERTHGGKVHEFDDHEGLAQTILQYFSLYQNGQLKGNAEGIQRFTRRQLANDFARVLSTTINTNEPKE